MSDRDEQVFELRKLIIQSEADLHYYSTKAKQSESRVAALKKKMEGLVKGCESV